MRYLGTLMLLASVGMLLAPSLWEGRLALAPSGPAAVTGEAGPLTDTGTSTLKDSDFLPPWRGPAGRGEKDG